MNIGFEKYLAYLSQDWVAENVTPWLLTSGLRILAILTALYVAHRVIKVLVARLVKRVLSIDKTRPEAEREKRQETLISVIHTTMHIVLLIVGSMIILSELGVNIGPIMAAAGIGGLAFGFGGQYLIRDVINGLFILLENQYRVGDVVCFGDTCGSVEDINLRRTVLRDLDGTIHNVPNGDVAIASNMSKGYARVNVDIGVSYSANLEHVIGVINRVGNELAEDPEWKDKITNRPQFLRVNDFADSAVVIKILGETKPLEQWGVKGELRKRLKIAFDNEGIEIPFPQRVMHQAKD